MVLYICLWKLRLLGRIVEFLAHSFFFETMSHVTQADLKFHLDNDDLERLAFQSSHLNVPGLQVCAGSKLFQLSTRLGFIGTSWGNAKTHYMNFSSKLFLLHYKNIHQLWEKIHHILPRVPVAYSVICLVSAACWGSAGYCHKHGLPVHWLCSKQKPITSGICHSWILVLLDVPMTV